jgi:hypothetical protein
VDLSCLVIGTGKVLLEWHSPQHVGLEECYFKPSNVSEGFFEYLHDEKHFDYFHITSIDIDHNSNLLVSARGTFTIYKIDRKSNEIIWRLGSKMSEFKMGPGTRFAYQHDARRQPDGRISFATKTAPSQIATSKPQNTTVTRRCSRLENSNTSELSSARTSTPARIRTTAGSARNTPSDIKGAL